MSKIIFDIINDSEIDILSVLPAKLKNPDTMIRESWATILKSEIEKNPNKVKYYQKCIDKILEDTSGNVKKVGIEILTFLPDSFDKLINYLKSKDEEIIVRIECINSLKKLFTITKNPYLLYILHDIAKDENEDLNLRKKSILALIGVYNELEIIPIIENLIKKIEFDVSEIKEIFKHPNSENIVKYYITKLKDDKLSEWKKFEIWDAISLSSVDAVKETCLELKDKEKSIDIKIIIADILSKFELEEESKSIIFEILQERMCDINKKIYPSISETFLKLFKQFLNETLPYVLKNFEHFIIYYPDFISSLFKEKIVLINLFESEKYSIEDKRKIIGYLLQNVAQEPDYRVILLNLLERKWDNYLKMIDSKDKEKRRKALSWIKTLSQESIKYVLSSLKQMESVPRKKWELMLLEKLDVYEEEEEEKDELLKTVELLSSIVKNKAKELKERVLALETLSKIGKRNAMNTIVEALNYDELKDEAENILISLGVKSVLPIKKLLSEGKIKNTEIADEIINVIFFKVRREKFKFDDILKLDNKTVQLILREVDGKDLALALKGAKDEIKNKIFSAMSERAKTILKEDMEYMGPVRKIDVLVTREKIISVIQHLAEAGEILLLSDEEVVV